ncbi:hypothetical protein AB5I41_31515 [Sphingomonas sp. MMS24-JH45]
MGTDALFQDTDAIVGWIETWPISFASAGGVTHEMSVTFDKGTTGDITFWIMQPELRQGADPRTLGYDETNTTAAAIATAASQTIAENTGARAPDGGESALASGRCRVQTPRCSASTTSASCGSRARRRHRRCAGF